MVRPGEVRPSRGGNAQNGRVTPETARGRQQFSVGTALEFVAGGLALATAFQVVSAALATTSYSGTPFGDRVLLPGYQMRSATILAVGAVLAALVWVELAAVTLALARLYQLRSDAAPADG
jgi:uncharacterized membrane protein YccF (DUF307 family)